jgi:hypothetical protein
MRLGKRNRMNRIVAIAGLAMVAGCAQYTTSDSERNSLSASADIKAARYLECVRTESMQLLGVSRDAAFVVERAKSSCASELESYRMAQADLLETQYIMYDYQLEAAVAELDQQSQNAVTDMLVDANVATAGSPGRAAGAEVTAAGAAAAPVAQTRPPASVSPSASAAAVPAAAGRASSTPVRPAPPAEQDFEPSFEQRVYMDCMRDQASKYVRLNESAADIAEVAANRCRTHLTGSNRGSLEAEGKVMVMGAIFDARLQATSPSGR